MTDTSAMRSLNSGESVNASSVGDGYPDHDHSIHADTEQAAAHRLGLLVYLLQTLHVLFGITAIIGMLISHTHINKNSATSPGNYIHSHLHWQIISFWVLAIAYIAAFIYFSRTGSLALVWLVLAIAIYRIARGWWQLHLRATVDLFW